jgi:hypothetical protein
MGCSLTMVGSARKKWDKLTTQVEGIERIFGQMFWETITRATSFFYRLYKRLDINRLSNLIFKNNFLYRILMIIYKSNGVES